MRVEFRGVRERESARALCRMLQCDDYSTTVAELGLNNMRYLLAHGWIWRIARRRYRLTASGQRVAQTLQRILEWGQ